MAEVDRCHVERRQTQLPLRAHTEAVSRLRGLRGDCVSACDVEPGERVGPLLGRLAQVLCRVRVKGGMSGTAADISIHADEILKMKQEMNEILARHTGQTVRKVAKDTERDNFMSPEDAKALLKVPMTRSIFPSSPKTSGVPRPFSPITPVPWASSTISQAS